MKCVTICNPYPCLIISGEKRIENRSWATSYRGPLAIHAGKSKAWLHTHSPLPAGMVFGAVVAVVDLVDCVRLDDVHAGKLPELDWIKTHAHASGPWCWVLANVRELAEPVRLRGMMGFFDVDNSQFKFKPLPSASPQ